MSKLHYKGWAIIPTALPTADHQWSASCDLARVTAHGEEIFEGATMQFVRPTEDEALHAACAEAQVQIDNIIANPTIRMA
ncbi:hypothetical protein FHW83_004417 [Duganella sp. SG902]|uniref:hypothetical protein n=1 Tax=Duganella sp. SG902 TaxID=2587016 RepID=UPI00159DC886|nr:hypothetical protein [Duganella sp. SG902]NVM78589.1 hypothetical protein [Duganella sp. SG902]